MRRLGAILLLGLILQYSFGMHIVYGWNSFLLKQSMKSAIATGHFQHNRIVTLTFPTEPLDSKENGDLLEDEIELDGKMYDVVSARQEGDRIIVQAISDDDETSLANAYQQEINGKPSSLPDKNITCLKGFFSPFIITTALAYLQPVVPVQSNLLLTRPAIIPAAQFAQVLTPPPRLV